MIDALVSGKISRTSGLKIGQSGKPFYQFSLSVAVEDGYTQISCIAFEAVAERIAKFAKGDAISVIGGLKPTEWTDKATGETRHGLSLTVSNALTAYDIKKRRTQPDKPSHPHQGGNPPNDPRPFDDDIEF